MSCETAQSKKINGYDKWEVESDARVLISAKELENGDEKYFKTLVAEVEKIAKAATEAAKVKDVAAKEVALTKKVGKKMKKIFHGSSHNSSGKSSGY